MPGGGGWETRPDPAAAGSGYFVPSFVINFGDPIFRGDSIFKNWITIIIHATMRGTEADAGSRR